MNRKLLFLLDLVLVGVVVSVGLQFRDARRAAKEREAAKLNRQLKPLPTPQYAPLAQVPAVSPLGYENIATKMLFDRSRNSVVIVEVPPPPAPKPMPPLPSYHGMMNLGGGPTAFFSASADAQHQQIHIGESIGQFKLLDVNSEEITLEWDGKPVRKSVAELSGQRGGGNTPQASQGVRTEVGSPTPAPVAAVKSGPGESTAFGFKTCAVNDGNAEGAIIDGYKKIMHTNPFGQNCTWEPVSK